MDLDIVIKTEEDDEIIVGNGSGSRTASSSNESDDDFREDYEEDYEEDYQDVVKPIPSSSAPGDRPKYTCKKRGVEPTDLKLARRSREPVRSVIVYRDDSFSSKSESEIGSDFTVEGEDFEITADERNDLGSQLKSEGQRRRGITRRHRSSSSDYYSGSFSQIEQKIRHESKRIRKPGPKSRTRLKPGPKSRTERKPGPKSRTRRKPGPRSGGRGRRRKNVSESESSESSGIDDYCWSKKADGSDDDGPQVDYNNFLTEIVDDTPEDMWTYTPFLKKCKICHLDFTSKSESITHESCYTAKRKMRELFANPPTEPFDCETCLAGFQTKEQLGIHAVTHFEPTYRCKMCEEPFEEESEIRNHLIIHDNIKKKYKCIVKPCERIFGDKSQALDHVERSHKYQTSGGIPLSRLKLPKEVYARKHLRYGKVKPVIDHPGELLNSGQPIDLDKFIAIKSERQSYEDMYTRVEDHKSSMTCSECSKTFKLNSIRFPYAYMHAPCYEIKQELREAEGKVIPENEFDCELCDKIFPVRIQLESHMACHYIPPFKCVSCDFKDESVRAMIIHSQVHTNEKILVCTFPGCEEYKTRWSDLEALYDHIRSKHLVKSEFRCNLLTCGIRFKSIPERQRHEQLEHCRKFPPKPTTKKAIDPNKASIPEFSGTVDEIFNQVEAYIDQYIFRKTKNVAESKLGKGYTRAPFSEECPLCNKVFHNKTYYLVHLPCYLVKRSKLLMEAGIEEAPRFECEFCRIISPTLIHLQNHVMEFHIDPQFLCNYCDKKFKHCPLAQRHVKKEHLKWKEFLCNYNPNQCSEEFHTLTDIREHLFECHLNPISVPCEFCNREYDSKMALMMHRRMIHVKKNRSWPCPVEGCIKVFHGSHKTLKVHLRKVHPEYVIFPSKKQRSKGKPMGRPPATPKEGVPNRVEIVNGVVQVFEASNILPGNNSPEKEPPENVADFTSQ